MGEAKRRVEVRQRQEEQLGRVDIGRVATVVRQLATVVSSNPGRDCLLHAIIGHGLLSDLGVDCLIAIGVASWRVGEGDGDMVCNDPRSEVVPQVNGAYFHAWIEIGHYILDLTTYHLRRKAALIDSSDGGRTCVDWCPAYLFVKKEAVSSYEDAVMNEHAGVYNYERFHIVEPWMQTLLTPEMLSFLLGKALEIYSDPFDEVFGSWRRAA